MDASDCVVGKALLFVCGTGPQKCLHFRLKHGLCCRTLTLTSCDIVRDYGRGALFDPKRLSVKARIGVFSWVEATGKLPCFVLYLRCSIDPQKFRTLHQASLGRRW